ncbi:MAG: hypothetical protein NTX55_00425 [Candidatus Parcubacteria bacterium]|nr:hypothetical protein [Candidatus Parcubacteria bacterium]
MEDFQKLLTKIGGILNKLKIHYYVTGGYAISVWGRPRSTFDIDVIIKLSENQIDVLTEKLKSVSEINYVEKQDIENAVAKEKEFNFIHGDSGIKVDFWIWKKNDDFEISAMKRRVAKKILDEKIYFISPEDLILSKLIWYKKTETSKHLEDTESVLKISGKKLDKKYLTKWAKKLKVSKILNRELKYVMIEK